MPLNERIYKLEQLLKNRAVVPFALMQERTEASRATLNRDIQFMRDRLRMPVVFDKEDSHHATRQEAMLNGACGSGVLAAIAAANIAARTPLPQGVSRLSCLD